MRDIAKIFKVQRPLTKLKLKLVCGVYAGSGGGKCPSMYR